MKKESIDKPKCDNCALCLDLSVYKPQENEEIKNVLNKYDISRVCLAFAYENKAVIGSFNGVGCECYKPKLS